MALNYIIAITDRDKHRKMAGAVFPAGSAAHTDEPAMGTARSEHLALYGLDLHGEGHNRQHCQRRRHRKADKSRKGAAVHRYTRQWGHAGRYP